MRNVLVSTRPSRIQKNELSRFCVWQWYQITIGVATLNWMKFRALFLDISQWQEAFLSFDLDNSGTIDANELKNGKAFISGNQMTQNTGKHYHICRWSWWRHQMEIFSTLLALCEGNPQVTGVFPSQRPVTWSFDVFFHVSLNKLLRKQSRCRWSETPWHSLWRHCNVYKNSRIVSNK